jgi:hypothetical protein
MQSTIDFGLHFPVSRVHLSRDTSLFKSTNDLMLTLRAFVGCGLIERNKSPRWLSVTCLGRQKGEEEEGTACAGA